MYVQYGSGAASAPEGWLNFDASPTLRFERLPVVGKLYTRNSQRFPDSVSYGDVTTKLPVDDGACEGVYCCHVLEHLCHEDFDRAVRETFRILKPGGIFRLVVPDLQQYAERYLYEISNGVTDANYNFMRDTRLGLERRQLGIQLFFLEWLGHARHLWMWDYQSLHRKLELHGFENIRPAYFNDCEDSSFRAVENPGRFKMSCAVQAMRPR